MAHRRISLKKELIDRVEKFIEENPDHGYRSIAQFVEDAIRHRAEEIGVYLSENEENQEQPH